MPRRAAVAVESITINDRGDVAPIRFADRAEALRLLLSMFAGQVIAPPRPS